MFDCGKDASPREVQGDAVFMDALRRGLGEDAVPDPSFVFEAILKSDDYESVLCLFVRELFPS